MAKQDSRMAALEFMETDIEDKEKLRALQFRITCAEKFDGWLQELITRGREALEVQHGTKK